VLHHVGQRGPLERRGAKHNFINDSDTEELKLDTLYSPPEHRDGTIHPTKSDALSHEEHFDGRTSE
jgi:hypothetical protein